MFFCLFFQFFWFFSPFSFNFLIYWKFSWFSSLFFWFFIYFVDINFIFSFSFSYCNFFFITGGGGGFGGFISVLISTLSFFLFFFWRIPCVFSSFFFDLIYFIYALFIFSFSHLSFFIFFIVATFYNNNFSVFSDIICVRIFMVFNMICVIIWWYLFNDFVYNRLWCFNLSVLFTSILLKYGNSFKNSSSHIIFAGLFLSLLLNRSRGCCSSGFIYCTSDSCFIFFWCFKRSRGCSGTFLMYSISLLWFLFFCISLFCGNIWGSFFSSVWPLINWFLIRRLILFLGCKGVF